MERNNIIKLIVAIVVSQLAGIIGSIFTTSSIPTWYASLVRPDIAPPNFLFGPVWVTLYFLMGVAAYLVWKQGFGNRNIKIALGVFGIQLVLNTLWSIIFFGLKDLSGAFIEIIILWIVIVANIYVFYRVDKRAAYLLIPYILWVSFAAFLNYSFMVLN